MQYGCLFEHLTFAFEECVQDNKTGVWAAGWSTILACTHFTWRQEYCVRGHLVVNCDHFLRHGMVLR